MLEPTEFVECSFDGAFLKDVSPGRSTFRRRSFRDVKIFNFRCHEAEFIDCVFTGRIRHAIFDATLWNSEGLGRTRNEYRGNDFSGARLYTYTLWLSSFQRSAAAINMPSYHEAKT